MSRLRPAAVIPVLAAVGAALAIAAAPSASGSAAGSTAGSTAGATVDRTIRDARIGEASGLAPSLDHPGVLWTHNDSNNPPLLYAIRTDGSTAAAIRLEGVTNRDWEAIAGYRDTAGRSMLAVGDIGDNAAVRSRIEVAILPEPALRDAVLRPARTLSLRYPAGPSNAETLLVDQVARRMYVVTKGLGSTVFEVPPEVWPGVNGVPSRDAATLIRVGVVPLILVTDGVVAPDGHVLLRTYGELDVLPPIDPGMVDGSLQPLASVRLPDEPQGEGIALAGTSQVLLASEGLHQPVLRMQLPEQITELLSSPGATGGTSTGTGTGSANGPATTGGSAPTATAAPGSTAPSHTAVMLVTALLGAGVLAAVGLVLARARRRF